MKELKESARQEPPISPNDLALAPAGENLSENKESEKAGCQQRLVLPLDTLSFWGGLRKGLLRIRSMKLLNILVKKGFPLDRVDKYVIKTDNKGSWKHQFNCWVRIPLLWRVVSAK